MLHGVSAAPGNSVGWSRLGTDDDKVTSMIIEIGHKDEVASLRCIVYSRKGSSVQ